MKSAIADEIAFGGYKDGFNFIRATRGFHPILFGFHRASHDFIKKPVVFYTNYSLQSTMKLIFLKMHHFLDRIKIDL